MINYQLDCCDPLELIKLRGISLPKLHCLARCQGAVSILKHASCFTVEDLRRDIITVCEDSHAINSRESDSTGEVDECQQVMICAYDRSVLGQSGSGHFSPIGGYHRGKDLVLILDVARYL